MADRNDIRIWNNAQWSEYLELTDDDDVARDLTGWTDFKTQLRSTPSSAAVIAELSSGAGTHALSATPTDGRLYYLFTLAVLELITPGAYRYDTVGIPVGETDPVLLTWGTVEILDGVTLQ